MTIRARFLEGLIIALLVLSFGGPPVAGQMQPCYSVDFQGPTAAGGLIGPDTILPGGPPVCPPAWLLPLAPAPATGQVEIDAMSMCAESLNRIVVSDADTVKEILEARVDFSVDEFAAGIATSPLAPNVTSEGSLGWREASADIFNFLATTLPPVVNPPAVSGNTALWDGNGFAPWGGPGLALIERNPPATALPDRGDNLDAMFYNNWRSTWVFFSLDAAWPDPLEVAPANSGTAAANGYSGGDILVYVPGATPPIRLYATAQQLGLGPLDDVDALIVHETGDGVFNPSPGPYQWDEPEMPFVGHDMVLFSVRRGSPIIGTIDSYRGLPIEEGDVLMVMFNGMAAPGIFIPAEAMGLRTARGNFVLPFGFADDLDGMGVPRTRLPAACDPVMINP